MFKNLMLKFKIEKLERDIDNCRSLLEKCNTLYLQEKQRADELEYRLNTIESNMHKHDYTNNDKHTFNYPGSYR